MGTTVVPHQWSAWLRPGREREMTARMTGGTTGSPRCMKIAGVVAIGRMSQKYRHER